jgi:hypothetical protein
MENRIEPLVPDAAGMFFPFIFILLFTVSRMELIMLGQPVASRIAVRKKSEKRLVRRGYNVGRNPECK